MKRYLRLFLAVGLAAACDTATSPDRAQSLSPRLSAVPAGTTVDLFFPGDITPNSSTRLVVTSSMAAPVRIICEPIEQVEMAAHLTGAVTGPGGGHGDDIFASQELPVGTRLGLMQFGVSCGPHGGLWTATVL